MRPESATCFFCDDALLAVFLDESRFGDCVVCRNDSTFLIIDDRDLLLSFFLSRLTFVLFIHNVSRPVNFTFWTDAMQRNEAWTLSLSLLAADLI